MRRKKTDYISKIFLYVMLCLICVTTFLPLLWMVSASLKLDREVFTIPIRWIPDEIHLENYSAIWEKINFTRYTWNSFKLTVIITLIQLFTCTFAAYGFAKCKFPGRDALFMLYVATIAVPWQVYMLPQYVMIERLRLVDTHFGYILMKAFTAFGVFLMRQFYMGIPDELLEAARIDGLSEYGCYARIMLPLVKPAIATLTIISFVDIWNDYMGPMIYFNSDRNKTIPIGIRQFIGQYSTRYNYIMAASVLALIPVIIVYLFCQKYFIEGIASSGIKG